MATSLAAEAERDLEEELERARDTAEQTRATIRQTEELQQRVHDLLDLLDHQETLSWVGGLILD